MWEIVLKFNLLIFIWNTGSLRQNPPAFWLESVYSSVIEVADFKYQRYLHHKTLVLKIHVFARIKVTITIENYRIYLLFNGIPYKTFNIFNTINTHNTLNTLDTLTTLIPLNTLKTFLTNVYRTTMSWST